MDETLRRYMIARIRIAGNYDPADADDAGLIDMMYLLPEGRSYDDWLDDIEAPERENYDRVQGNLQSLIDVAKGLGCATVETTPNAG